MTFGKTWTYEEQQAYFKSLKRKGYILKNTPPKDFYTAEVSGYNTKDNLLIQGRAGRGKTYTACAIMRKRSDTESVGLITDSEIIMRAKKCFSSNENEFDFINRLLVPDLLVIDDLGKFNVTEWSSQIIFAVIDGRIKKDAQTIVTTQFSSKSLMEKISNGAGEEMADAIISRLGSFRPITIEGSDKRTWTPTQS